MKFMDKNIKDCNQNSDCINILLYMCLLKITNLLKLSFLMHNVYFKMKNFCLKLTELYK